MSTNQPQSVDESAVEMPPEHVVTPALRRRLQQCYDHGQKLLAKENPDHDYANTMFTECAVKDPSNLVYIEAFLSNLQGKYNNNKKGARSLGFGGGGKKGEFKKAVSSKAWIDVLKLGPEILKTNPWDVPTLRGMAQACEFFRYNEVELRYLKNALDANPKDIEVNRHCAESLARMGQFDQAIACWHRLEDLCPKDPEPPKMIAGLSIEKTRVRTMGVTAPSAPRRGSSSQSGTSAKSAAPAASDESASKTETKRREVQLTPIQRLEKTISDDPTVIENYLELADLYIDEHKYPEAERVLQRAQNASPGDPDVLNKIEDLATRRLKHQLKVAEKRAAAENTPQARELVEQIRSTLLRQELDIANARSQRFPENLALKLRLGHCLKKVGNYREAAAQFQAAREDPEQYVGATLELGECWQQLKQYVKALHCYQRAAEKGSQRDEVDLRKLALYRAGVLAMGMKERSTAEKALRELLQIDSEFKDARARLDKILKMSDNS